MLRLSNEIGNRASGPLEVFPSAISADCDGDGDPANDRDASQRIFADTNGSGGYEAGVDAVESERVFGCMRYHPAHDHWHMLDVARYELRREATGKLVADSRKVGFCLTDTRLAFPTPLTPQAATYPIGSAKPTGCDAISTQGDLGRLGRSLRLGAARPEAARRRAASRRLLPHLARRPDRSDRGARRGQ